MISKLTSWPKHAAHKTYVSTDIPWSSSLLIRMEKAHKEFKDTPDIESVHSEYRHTIVNFYYIPLHYSILKRVQTPQLQKLLTTIYTGYEETLLEKITQALYFEYFDKNGIKDHQKVLLTKTDLQRLHVSQKTFFSAMHDVGELLRPVFKINLETITFKDRLASITILPSFPKIQND